MQLNKYDTMIEAIESLKRRGFTHDFEIKEGKLYSLEADVALEPKDVAIVEYHRFEGESSAGDMSVVYAIESKKGLKGTIVDAYGTYANAELADFIKNVKVPAEE